MAQYQIYKPNAPGGSRELQKDLFSGSEADIQARKAAGEDLSYTQVGGDAAAPTPQPQPAAGGGVGGSPPAGGASSPAMASLMGEQPPDPMMDVSLAGPSGLRQGMGTRHPPQYNYALASLGRGVY